jgi:adenylate cyclase
MADPAGSLARAFAEFRRRRVFRVAAAYVVFGWLVLQVADATFEPLDLPAWSQRALIIAIAVGFPVACVLAWIYDITAGGVVRTPPLPVAPPEPAALPAAPAAEATAPTLARDASIAILPFTDLSQARDQAYFCDGLAEEIIDALCCARGLRVASRTASFRFRDGSVDPREIGRQLGVGAILEGSVRKAGDQLRVTAQLIDTRDGYHLWSHTYDRPLADIFAIQSEIARCVAGALKLSLAGSVAGRFQRYAPRNIEAYDFYLRGRQLMAQINGPAWRAAPQMFRRAIELDADYAQAHAGLADSIAQLVLWRYANVDHQLPAAHAAAQRALELAPDLAEAHVAQGHLASLTGDDAGAQRAFERAIALNPDLHEAHYYFGRHCFARGDYRRAADLLEAAHRVRPTDFTVLGLAVNALDASGQRERGDAVALAALRGLQHQAELEPDNARARYTAALLHQRTGDVEAGRPLIEEAVRQRPDEFGTLYNAACFYSLAGEPERALDLLERGSGGALGHPGWMEHDPDLAALRDHPRFRALVGGGAGSAPTRAVSIP